MPPFDPQPVNPPPDRIFDALLMQTGQEATQRTRNPGMRRDDPYLLDLRRRQYESIVDGYSQRRDLSRGERQSLIYVRARIRKLNAQLRPTRLTRLRYWPPVDWLINWFRGRAARMHGINRRLQDEDRTTVRQQNIQRLSQELKKAGFNVSMEAPLKRAIAQDRPYFYLPYAASDDARTEYNLFFRKLPGSDTYYLEGFDAAAKPTVAEALRTSLPLRPQHFSLIEDACFSAKEAASLVHQIPVAKTIEGQERWATLDARGNRNWTSFAFEEQLRAYPILDLRDPAREKALQSALRSGATREVAVVDPDDRVQKLKIQVDPFAADLLFKDSNGMLVDIARFPRPNENIKNILTRTQGHGIVRTIGPKIRG